MNHHAQLRKLMTSKLFNEGTKRAVRERLKIILEEECRQFRWWEDTVRQKLTRTRQNQVERRFNKEIQALKIVIHKLTPFMDRVDDEPSIIVKKSKKTP